MNHDDIRDHIRRAARGGTPTGRGISVRIIGACWPGGPPTEPSPSRCCG